MSANDDILDASSANEGAIGFKRHLVGPTLVFLILEMIGVVVPLLSLFGESIEDISARWRTAIPILVGAEIIWTALLWNWLHPLYKMVRHRRKGQRIPEELSKSVYIKLWKIPLRALALRTVLWALVVFLLGMSIRSQVGWDLNRVAELTAMGAFHALVCNIGRAVWLEFLMRRFGKQFFGGISSIRTFRHRYFRQLILVSVVCIGGTLAAVATFAYFFLPLSEEQYLRMQLFFPFAFLLTFAGIGAHCWRASKGIDAYLAAQEVSTRKGASLATAAYKDSQNLPYRFALSFWGLWLVTAVLAVLMAKSSWRLDTDDAVLMFGTVGVISIGSALYQALWHREVIRPLLDHLTLQHRLPVRGIGRSLSLRVKLTLSFGGMVLFAVGLALFWGFIQYKNLVTKFTASQADLGLAWVRSEIQGAVAAAEKAPDTKMVEHVMDQIGSKGLDAKAVVFFLPPGPGEKVRAQGGGIVGIPQLPWYAVAEMKMQGDAKILLRAHSLTGQRGRLRVTWHEEVYDLGSVAVFYPNYRGRGPSLVRPLRELLLFFLVLFGVCSGIVVLTVAQFVKPIRRLERRADGMARGELSEPVSSGGEGDEIGRLTFALEDMRRALREKLRSTEEMNIDLEHAVQRRTSDLATKNRELAETLEKLTRAQNQLIQAEKMASIGQLVAGIAHEINNPVNAIVNTVGPLEEAIDDLGAEEKGVREEAASDVKEMIRVVKRGAARTKGIVRALHNYSRTDEESVVEIDLNRCLDDSLELLRHIFKNKITVIRDYAEALRFVGHAGQINQVFMNLLTNAGQAVSGQEHAEVRISTQSLDGDKVKISISDNGQGMPPEVIGKIFDPFFTTKEVGEGSGLGLSIVHGIVERHQGRIEVESEPGRGTVFTLELPRGEGVAVSSGSAGDTLI